MAEKKENKKENKKESKDLDAQTKEVLETKVAAGNKIPVSMQIVIGLLAVVSLGLLGYIMYQVGKGGTIIGNKKDGIMREEVINDNISVEDSLSSDTIGDSNNSANDMVNTSSNDEENSAVASSDLKLSKDDMDKLNSDINKLSTDDDEFKEIQDTFDEGL